MKATRANVPPLLSPGLALAILAAASLGAAPPGPAKAAAGHWQLVGTFRDQPPRPPRSDVTAWSAEVADGSIRVHQEYRHPDEGPSTYDLSCRWTWSGPRGMDVLAPGDKLTARMTLTDASVPEKVSGWSHGYTGGDGSIRLTVGEARYAWSVKTASTREVLNVSVRHAETKSQDGEIDVPGPLSGGNGTLAVRAVCGAAFERIYEWRAGPWKGGPPPAAATPAKRRPKPLCPEGLARLWAEKRTTAVREEPPPAMTMDEVDLQAAFNSAILRYVERTGKRPYVDDNVGGTLPALTWLFTEGGLSDRVSQQFVFSSAAERAVYESKGGAPTTTARSRKGTEVYFYNSLYEAAMKRPGTKLRLDEIVYLALEQRDGNMKEAMLLAHNTFRSLARYREGRLGSTDRALTGVEHAPDVFKDYIEPFIDPPPQGPDQNSGAVYHLFGTAYFELQAQGAYGEGLVAEWVGFGEGTRAANRLERALQEAKALLSSDPRLDRPASRTTYSKLANEAEQLYREVVNRARSDPWKYCYNVFGARIGAWLYQERLLRRGLPGLSQAIGSLRQTFSEAVDRGLSIGASPVNVRWSGGGRSMTLDQRKGALTGEFPVRVLPYAEDDGSWGFASSELTEEPYELTFEGTATGWAHFTRTDPRSDDVYVYALPLAPGRTFTLAVRPGAVGAPMRGPRGESVVPVRLGVPASTGGQGGGDSATVGPRVNLAQGRPARQSSTGYGGDPSRAVDGNTGGDFMKRSVTHTAEERQPWWEVDLGAVRSVERVVVWNRTDCCDERLSDFDVLVSESPIAGDDLEAARRGRTVWSRHVSGRAERKTDLPVGRPGRYVRVQLAGREHLSLAEVEVFGPGSPAAPAPAAPAARELGDVWHVKQRIGSETWSWVWRRRPGATTFEATARRDRDGFESQHVLHLESHAGGKVVLYRPDAGGRYYGTLSPDGTEVVSGRVDFVAGDDQGWTARIR